MSKTGSSKNIIKIGEKGVWLESARHHQKQIHFTLMKPKPTSSHFARNISTSSQPNVLCQHQMKIHLNQIDWLTASH